MNPQSNPNQFEFSHPQLRKMSNQKTLTPICGNGTMGENVTRTSAPFTSGVYDPTTFRLSLSPNGGMQPIPGPASGGVPTMSRPQYQIRPQDRRPSIGLGPVGGGGGQRIPTEFIGGADQDHHPPILDLSEFPSLPPLTINRHLQLAQGDSYQSLLTKPYGGRIKQPQPESNGFTMSLEDFPALPGTTLSTTNINEPITENPEEVIPSTSQSFGLSDQRNSMPDQTIPKRSIVTCPDGKVMNIPPAMLNDQFGMVGLLTSIRVAETHPSLSSLARGFDLTALGLNLSTTDSLYPSFGGPWGEGPVKPEDIEYPVPQEYNISSKLREKLGPLKLTRFEDELLFHLFYNYAGDILQMLAASELYNRYWRYHKEEKIWITRAPGMQAVEKGMNFERGTYYVFHPTSWRKVTKEMYLDYDKIEGRPSIPPHFSRAFMTQ